MTEERVSAVLLTAVLAAGCVLAGDPLLEGFRAPPESAKPRIWWHWVNGNVSREGIVKDLEAIAEAGFGGVTPIDVGWYWAEGPVRFGSDLWFDTMAFAADEARRRGLKLTLPNCSGFSSSGGPWITPERGMKFMEWTETRVTGPAHFRGKLPQIADPCGYVRDIAVFAVPDDAAEKGPDGLLTASGARFRLVFPSQYYFAEGRMKVETSEDGAAFEPFAEIPLRLAQTGSNYDGLRFVAFPREGTARHWRLALVDAPDGVRMEDVSFLARPRIPDVRAKSLRVKLAGGAAPTLGADAAAVDAKDVLDLTDRMSADGTLDWEAPKGRWTVLRFAYAANGRKCHPASPSGEGLEVDKLDAAAVAFHYDSYVGRMRKRLGCFDGVLVDSYEMRSQNWTEGLEREFARRAGYALRPLLPVLAGVPVGSAAESEQVLRDFRRVVGELFAENYAGTLAAKCHADGLKLSLEPYGTIPAPNFDYGRFADVPTGEHWVRGTSPERGCACPLAVSLAHFYGRSVAACEAFTAAPGEVTGRWQLDPFGLKPHADRMFAEGVNRLVVHRFAHQPWADRVPGMTMGPWGTHFERTNTWWPFVEPFVAYLTRTQFLLQAGEPVVDALIETGDDVPNEGDNRKGVVDAPPAVPFGWSADCCSAAAARSLVRRTDGSVVAPGGLRYPLFVRSPQGARIDLGDAFRCAGIAPDLTVSALADRAAFAHRRYPARDGADAYFVAFANETNATVTCSFRTAGRVPEIWNAEDGSARPARTWRRAGDRTEVELALPPAGARFVVFRERTEATCGVRTDEPAWSTARRAEKGPWQVSFASAAKTPAPAVFEDLVSFTSRSEEDIRHFSGTATYRRTVALPAPYRKGARVVIDLGEVKNVARVTANGRVIGELWRPPFRADVTPALAEGATNVELKVEVANLWVNRLIGDAALAEKDRTTFSTARHWGAKDALKPSGLLGPVTVEVTGNR